MGQDATIPPARLAYEVAKSMYLIRKDHNRRFSVLGNEGRKIAEMNCMLILEQYEGLSHMISKLPKSEETYETPWAPAKMGVTAKLSVYLDVLRRFGNRADHAYERVVNPILPQDKPQIAV